MNKKLVHEFLLEAGRVVAIAILPILISSLERGEIDLKAVGIAGAIAVLKAVDRSLHETEVAKKGIVRF